MRECFTQRFALGGAVDQCQRGTGENFIDAIPSHWRVMHAIDDAKYGDADAEQRQKPQSFFFKHAIDDGNQGYRTAFPDTNSKDVR